MTCTQAAVTEMPTVPTLTKIIRALFFLPFCAQAASVCHEYSSRIPNLGEAHCEAAALQDMHAKTVLGRTIFGVDVAVEKPDLHVLVIGGIHGDEMTSGGLVYEWMSMANTHSMDTPLRIYWRFVPVVNPDGLFASPPRRTNAHGVDLNRNFPTPNWARDAKSQWEKSTRKDPRRWPGPSSGSEPETRFVLSQMASFKPNLIVSVHAPYAVLDFDGPFAPPRRLGRLYLDQIGVFPGSLGNYSGIHRHIPVVTVELPNARRMPQPGEVREMWKDLLHWVNDNLAK